MGRDPDFMITVDGEDLSKEAMAWDIHEVDDGISTISVIIANADMKYSGAIGFDGEISVMYGYADGEMDTVYANIKGITEHYAMGTPTITIKGECAVSDLCEGSTQGHSKSNKPTEAMKDAAKAAGVNLEVKKMEDPPYPNHIKIPGMPMSPLMLIQKEQMGLFSSKASNFGKGGGK